MTRPFEALFSEPFLRAHFADAYRAYEEAGEDTVLLARLRTWNRRTPQTETEVQAAFISLFFKQTWGYAGNGERPREDGFTCSEQYAVAGAGGGGGTGRADLALGWFGRPEIPPTPQALCEFKDIRSDLDRPQPRKGNTRSPVKQCADYLREAGRGLYGNESIQPTWGIVTDMNEFRLYWRDRIPTQFQRFVIQPDLTQRAEGAEPLLGEDERSRFHRFLFRTLFSADQLLTLGGRSPLLRAIGAQWTREREIETTFYDEYRAYRERLYNILLASNPAFPGTRGQLVNLTQKILDRLLFVLFCEDMGATLRYPVNLLRDYLMEQAGSRYYDVNGEEIWSWVRRLFAAMNAGGAFLDHDINRFNGGLFATDPVLDGLHIPNKVFCARNQGDSAEALRDHPGTLLYFSGTYNFGVTPSGERSIGLYTLGRIFEQSITELEALEAEVEGRPSLTKITKRKRDGVYYTPEWVVRLIVEETVGARLADIRAECGWDETISATLTAGQRSNVSSRQQTDALRDYRRRLGEVTVVDPACGSGAFLITTLEFLLAERRRVERELARLQGRPVVFDDEEETRSILARNIYGVDINPASVEIARLAVWLHTARRDRPLSHLDANIVDGNSLIGAEFWEGRALDTTDEDEQERVNAFDWAARFPQVFARGRFDCVVGNPPYVKLQNFRKVHADMADWLTGAARPDRPPPYHSTRTGNFDLFLPFIERSLDLLNTDGRMGFIAPSLWLLNEYGEGLRRYIHRTRQLDRWIDFKSFQVFEEAITYTALQFYSRRPHDAIRLALAPDGGVSVAQWDDPDMAIPYAELPAGDAWVLLPRVERDLIARLAQTCNRLDDPDITTAIFQGLITSADSVYHLRRVGLNLYKRTPKSGEPYEVAIEDGLMRPLVSGEEAKRYTSPATDTWILFPYRGARLLSCDEMYSDYPNGWCYLRTQEEPLRAREGGKFDDDFWWRFGRNQNIERQSHAKILVPRLIKNLFCAMDPGGDFCVDNVDVGGVLLRDAADLPFIAAVLNGPVADFVWRRISKPFQNDYRSANKQFIAPLPVPSADVATRRRIGVMAQGLQALHTERRDCAAGLNRRLDVCPLETRPEEWLWPDLGTMADWQRRAPRGLAGTARRAWARERRKSAISERLDRIQRRLRVGGRLSAELRDGCLVLAIDGVAVIDSTFVEEAEAPLLIVQWVALTQSFQIAERTTAAQLAKAFRTVRVSNSPAVRQQVLDRSRDLAALDARIAAAEVEMNESLFELYELTPEERALVEADVGRRR